MPNSIGNIIIIISENFFNIINIDSNNQSQKIETTLSYK